MSCSADRDLLKLSSLFEGLGASSLDAIRAGATLRQLAPGAVLIKQGDDPTHLYLVVQGRLKVGHITRDGSQIALGYLGRGELVGCISVLRPMLYPIAAKAVESSVVLGWSAAQMEAWQEDHPVLLRNTVRILSAQLDDLLHRLTQFSTERVEQRVARALQRMLKAAPCSAAGADLALPLSRQDLAELAGATLFTVSRIMSAWEQQGIVESKRRSVTVRNIARLAGIAEGQ